MKTIKIVHKNVPDIINEINIQNIVTVYAESDEYTELECKLLGLYGFKIPLEQWLSTKPLINLIEVTDARYLTYINDKRLSFFQDRYQYGSRDYKMFHFIDGRKLSVELKPLKP